jgi:hypothetical protein
MNKKNRIEQMPRRRHGGTYNDSLGQGPSAAEQAAKAAEQARKDDIERRTVNTTYAELSCKGVTIDPGARYDVEIRPKRVRITFEGDTVAPYDAVQIYVPDGYANPAIVNRGDNSGLTSKPCGSTSLWYQRDSWHPNRGVGTEFFVYMKFDDFIKQKVTGEEVEWKSGNGAIGHLNTLKGVFAKVRPLALQPSQAPPPPPAKAPPPPPPKKAPPPLPPHLIDFCVLFY